MRYFVSLIKNNSWNVRLIKWLLLLKDKVQQILHSFTIDQCLLRASALTYVTALSIVPFLAVAFSISKGLGFQNTEYLRNFLLRLSAGRVTIVEHVIDYINRTNVGTLGVIGIGLLFITVFTLLSTIEQSLNKIWGVKYQRSLSRKFTDYLSVTLVCPLLILVAISFSASLESFVIVQKILSLSVFSYFYLFFLKLMPVILVCLALLFVYKFIPNTRVSWKGGVCGSIVAGVLWQGIQSLFITYQIGVSKYNAIYGSFAQVPLFLIWIYLSWIIILFGAEVGYYLEDNSTVKGEGVWGPFGLKIKEQIVLAILAEMTKKFEFGQGDIEINRLSERLYCPVKLIRQILYVLTELGYVLPVSLENREAHVLARSPSSFTCSELLHDFRDYRDSSQIVLDETSFKSLNPYFKPDFLYQEDPFNKSMSSFAQEILTTQKVQSS